MPGARAMLSRLGPYNAWVVRNNGWLSCLATSVLVIAAGFIALFWRELVWHRYGDEVVDWQEMGMDPFQRLSFDAPFLVRSSLRGVLGPLAGPIRPADEIVLVYMDDAAALKLDQPLGGPWSRAMHAKLVDVMTQQGARAVLFDAVFDRPSQEDPVFASALARNGKTFLGATIYSNNDVPLTNEQKDLFMQVGLSTEQLSKRIPSLYPFAAGWGLLTFRPIDGDYSVRRLYVGKQRAGLGAWPSLTWQVAKALGADLPADDKTRFERRWVNYYGPAHRMKDVSYYRAVSPEGGVPAGYFKDKIVFVGARTEIGNGPSKLLDEFSTPWSRFGARAYTPGTEIHATILLNLLHHDWLGRLPPADERWAIGLVGAASGMLCWLRPKRALIAAILASLALFAGACLLQWHSRQWCNWAVPALVQMPLAGVLALGSRYYFEERHRRKLRGAFECYVPPALADEIAQSGLNLAPGGKTVEATMVFTDIADFTQLSEELSDSEVLGDILTEYFTKTTKVIFDEDGTVIKFIGDAVYAVWGAPLPQANHAERAVRAAWQLAQIADMRIRNRRSDGTPLTVKVRTRIGVHTGEALAGNLGSDRRFDYTLIGDSVNLASRLEGANKYLGTSVLISGETAAKVAGMFHLRRLGVFKVKGRKAKVEMFEPIGEKAASSPEWLEVFDAALAAWTSGDFAGARAGFENVRAARAGNDGPSEFYLARLLEVTPGSDWRGEVTLEDK